MTLNRLIAIILLLPLCLPSVGLYAEGSVFGVSPESENKLLAQEGLLVTIDKKELQQYLQEASLLKLIFITSSLATAMLCFGNVLIMMKLEKIMEAVGC